jgi:polar amino acid transport system substrate-binding protein
MKQVIQRQKTGKMSVEEFPIPILKAGFVLVQNAYSLISAGTERTTVQRGQASLVENASKNPALVKQVLRAAQQDGWIVTYKKVRSRLEGIKELGYSSAGIVLESSIDDFRPGDRVACAGGGFASHAQIISVPRNLAVPVPQRVSLDDAAFTTLGAIALQGIRQADVRIGERVAVVGLGLLGLITVQLLKASGCSVIGLDISGANFKLARQLGCDVCVKSNASSKKHVESFSNGFGVDAVILTAATESNEPLELALQFARKRGRVVVVGAVGMNVPRSPFYEKELELRISTSYGPGRYDADYEVKGLDYPFSYVRWTERRNMQAFLDLVASGRVNVKPLVTHTIPIENASSAYDLLLGKSKEKYLAILLSYPEKVIEREQTAMPFQNVLSGPSTSARIGFIGAGNFAQSNLLPSIKDFGGVLADIVNSSPVSTKVVSERFGFQRASSDPASLIESPDSNIIFVASRHDSHADFVVSALRAKKHVFVEKPLALNEHELKEIERAYREVNLKRASLLMVGFNRRFSKLIREMRRILEEINEPTSVLYRVNAGFVSKDHWIQDPVQGGRIVGEVCHFVDTLQFLTGSEPVRVVACSLRSSNTLAVDADNVSIVIDFKNGSVGTILYQANGDVSVDKEYCEVYAGGTVLRMENFRSLSVHRQNKVERKKFDGTKGHREEIKMFLDACTLGGESPIDFPSLRSTTRTTFGILSSLRTASIIELE